MGTRAGVADGIPGRLFRLSPEKTGRKEHWIIYGGTDAKPFPEPSGQAGPGLGVDVFRSEQTLATSPSCLLYLASSCPGVFSEGLCSLRTGGTPADSPLRFSSVESGIVLTTLPARVQ